MKKSPVKKLTTLFALFAALTLAVLYFSDPRSGVVVIMVFLASLLMSVFSLFTLVFYLLRRSFNKNERLGSELKTSAREGLLVAAYAGAILGLSSIKLLTWWDSLLLALSLILFEVYFTSGKEQVL